MEMTHTRQGSNHVRCTEYRATKHLWERARLRGVWALKQLVQSLQLASEGQQGNIRDFKWKKMWSSFDSQKSL